MVSGPVAVAAVYPGIGQNDGEPQTGSVNDNKSTDHTLPETIPQVNPEKPIHEKNMPHRSGQSSRYG